VPLVDIDDPVGVRSHGVESIQRQGPVDWLTDPLQLCAVM
jgi:hypothetical protein